MSFSHVIWGFPGQQFTQTTARNAGITLGTLMIFEDGRKFRYCKAGELLVCGESLQGPDEEVEVDLTVAAGSLGDEFISVTGKGSEAEDFYKEGYISISLPGSTKVRLYRVKSHLVLAISAGHKIFIEDDGGTQEALVGDEEATLQANPWDGVITNDGTTGAGFAGVACEDIASSSYGWVQTGGLCVASLNTAAVEAGPVTCLSGATGKLDVVGADTEPPVGYVSRGQTGTGTLEASLVILTVD
jgi:hypothetical protein